MDRIEVLQKVGLKKDESLVYQTLLERGVLGVSEIAKHSLLHRPVVYKIIPVLLRKGLISQSLKGKRAVYVAESPRILEQLFDATHKTLIEAIPEMLQLHQSHVDSKPFIRIFQGKEGLKAVYNDLLSSCKKGSVFYRYESHKTYKANKKYIPQAYFARIRDNNEIDRYIITNEATGKQKKNRIGRIVKMVPESFDMFTYNITHMIYANKVAFIDFSSETAFVVESELFMQFQKKIFQLLFEKL
jgi:sugar-specific transcriptional regulator TrmB